MSASSVSVADGVVAASATRSQRRSLVGRLLALALLAACLAGAGLMLGVSGSIAARPAPVLALGGLALIAIVAALRTQRRSRPALASLMVLLCSALLGTAAGLLALWWRPEQAQVTVELVAAVFAVSWGLTWLVGWALVDRSLLLRYALVGLGTLVWGTLLLYRLDPAPLVYLIGCSATLLTVGVVLDALDAVLARHRPDAVAAAALDLLGAYPRALIALFRLLVASER